MASIERTAYPRFQQRMSAEELRARYGLTETEQDFVTGNANGGRQRLTLAVLLKTRQQLGYFPALTEVPVQIKEFLAGQLGFAVQIRLLSEANLRTTLHRYRTAVRDFIGSKPYCPADREHIEQVIRKAAATMSDPADLINVAVAELSKAGIELPAYSTLQKTENAARQKLVLLRDEHRELEESLLAAFGKVLAEAKQAEQSDAAFGKNVRQVLLSQGGAESLREQYEAVAAYHQNNFRPLLWPVHVGYRAVLFRLLDLLAIGSATQDAALMEALAFVKEHRHSRKDTLPHEIDLGFAGQRWQIFIETDKDGETVLNRRAVEVCVFIHLAEALHRLDVYVEGSEGYADYRRQLLPGEEWRQRLPAYCEAAGLPADGKAFVAGLKQQLTDLSREVDAGFPENAELTIGPDGKPRLKQLQKLPLPDGLDAFVKAVQERMPQRHLLDILQNVQCWTGFARHFGPPSGSDPKLPEAERQYVRTVFGYGCNLGASQTANHIPEAINRHTMRRINFQHITAAKLDAGRNDVTAAFIRFAITGCWGDGKTVIADGTHIETRENTSVLLKQLREVVPRAQAVIGATAELGAQRIRHGLAFLGHGVVGLELFSQRFHNGFSQIQV